MHIPKTVFRRSGFIVLDKPAGKSSAGVVAAVKRSLNAPKVGHTGTLDPFATGVLICGVNQATKLSRFFLHGRKTYQAELRLGVETDTQDASGRIIAETSRISVGEAEIHAAVETFKGSYRQQPPVFSALKHRGRPLYHYARSGLPVQKPARQVEIYEIRVLDFNPPGVDLLVTCSAGTYIRTLCADIGARLGCGGHLGALRRLRSGGFSIETAVSLDKLAALAARGQASEALVAMADALPGFAEARANKSLTETIKHGRMLTLADLRLPASSASEGFVKVLDPDRNLLAVLNRRQDRERLDYVCVFNPD